jgi:hypothetical protein
LNSNPAATPRARASEGARRLGQALVAADPALLQGAYWFLAGLWPLVHLRSFVAVTGPKADDWLVRTIGALIMWVGAVLMAGSRRRERSPEIAALGLGAGAALVAADVIYVARGRISKVYLLDAVAHLPLFAAWALDLCRSSSLRSRSPE